MALRCDRTAARPRSDGVSHRRSGRRLPDLRRHRIPACTGSLEHRRKPNDLCLAALFDCDAGKASTFQRRTPPNQHFIEITIPNGVTYEMLNPAHLPGWDDISREASRAYDDAWQTSRRSLLLLVPSVVARMARNVLINPEHAEFPRITHSLHQPVWWDRRLFGTAAWRLCRGPAYRPDIEAETPRWRGYRRWHVIRAVTFVKPSASGLR